MTDKPAVPFVNLNGTSRADLLKQQTDVMAAARNLLEALSRATPHGRDYYGHVERNTYQAARAQHDERTKAVHRIMKEAEQIALHINKEG